MLVPRPHVERDRHAELQSDARIRFRTRDSSGPAQPGLCRRAPESPRTRTAIRGSADRAYTRRTVRPYRRPSPSWRTYRPSGTPCNGATPDPGSLHAVPGAELCGDGTADQSGLLTALRQDCGPTHHIPAEGSCGIRQSPGFGLSLPCAYQVGWSPVRGERRAFGDSGAGDGYQRHMRLGTGDRQHVSDEFVVFPVAEGLVFQPFDRADEVDPDRYRRAPLCKNQSYLDDILHRLNDSSWKPWLSIARSIVVRSAAASRIWSTG